MSATTETPLADLQRLLPERILQARQRVYRVGEKTPLQRYVLPEGTELFIKREDISPIHSYKWRGSYNRMAQLSREERLRGVVTASAGNHAQGVALATRKLGTTAEIFMPRVTPRLKVESVQRIGGDAVTIIQEGETLDVAARAARLRGEESNRTYIHAYDDLEVVAGQGTMADEIVMSGEGPFDAVFLQIGGGGMAAGVSTWLRQFFPDITCIGVEGVQQASMLAAREAGEPVRLDYLDVFCDGTAVREVGAINHAICAQSIDRIQTVTNEEVCAAIQTVWNLCRVIPEPSGAMGLAGFFQERERWAGKRILTVICGANVDFNQLSTIVRQASFGQVTRRYLRFQIPEKRGTVYHILQTYLEGLNIVEFQYGRYSPDEASLVIGVEGSPASIQDGLQRAQRDRVEVEDATGADDVQFAVLGFAPELMHFPFYAKIEFPERSGALRDFLSQIQEHTDLGYFNYIATGERVGRALLGFSFTSAEERNAFPERLRATGITWREPDARTLHRLTSSP